MTNKTLSCTIVLMALLAEACDPGHHGKAYIRNESSFALELVYKTRTKDTVISIGPGSLTEVFRFGGPGAGRDYDCCPCEFIQISLQPTDTTRILMKSITDRSNWSILNPNSRRFSSKEISCEFSVRQSDIQ